MAVNKLLERRAARQAQALAAAPPPADPPESSATPTAEPAPKRDEPAVVVGRSANKLLARRAGRAAPSAPSVRAGTLPVGVDVGRIEQYQAAVDAALSAMAPMPAMSEERTAYKRSILPQVLPFVGAYIDQGDRYPNPVATQVLVWLFDTGEIEQAVGLGLYLVGTGVPQPMPKKFDRDLPTFFCDAVWEWADAQLKAGSPAAPYLDQVLLAIERDKWALHPAVASKLYAKASMHAERQEDWASVVALCEKAQQVNPESAGVKTRLESARKRLAQQAEK